jgi:hypothetical protein
MDWIDSAWIAAASRTAFSTASLFITGKTPGKPVQTGQMFVFGESNQESALQLQKILEAVFSWIWVSNPMMASNADIASLH